VVHKLCPPKQAPDPLYPDPDLGLKPGGKSLFARYGYAGLTVTTYDSGCFEQVKGGGAQGLNAMVDSIDSLVNAMQMRSQDGSLTRSTDEALPEAVVAIRDAFWSRWMGTAFAAAGVLLLLYGAVGRGSAFLEAGTNVLLVAALVPWLFTHPTTLTDLSHRMTTGTAQAASDAMLRIVDPGAVGQHADNPYGEGYFQVAYRSWMQTMCLDRDPRAQREFAPRFYAAQAYSVDEAARMAVDPGAQAGIVKAKAKAWLAAAEQLKAELPAVYGCWRHGGANAWGPVFKHGTVTMFAGFWLALLSIGMAALGWMLPFGLLLLAGFALVMIVSHRMTTRFYRYLLTGLVGPPMLALLAAVLEVMFLIVLSDPKITLPGVITAGAGLGVAALFSLRFLGSALLGFGAVEAARMATRRGRSRGRGWSRRHSGVGYGAAGGGRSAGAAAGGAAAGAAGGGGDVDDSSEDFDRWEDEFDLPVPDEDMPEGTYVEPGEDGRWHRAERPDEPFDWSETDDFGDGPYDVDADGGVDGGGQGGAWEYDSWRDGTGDTVGDGEVEPVAAAQPEDDGGVYGAEAEARSAAFRERAREQVRSYRRPRAGDGDQLPPEPPAAPVE
jgi:hypothetical protein